MLKNLSLPFYLKLACVLICILLLGYLAILGYTILAPFLIGFLCAVLLLPLSSFFERKLRMPRSLASLLSSVALLLALIALFTLLGAQITSLANDWPAFKAQLLSSISELQLWISDTFHVDNKEQMAYINEAASKSLSTGTTIVSKTILSISSVLFLLLFSFLYSFFILLHRRLIVRFLVSLFNDNYAPVVLDVVKQIQYIIKRYIIGLIIQMTIVTILACAAYSIIGVKYSFLLGLITGIFNIIPYIGIFSSLLLTILITFATSTASHVLFVIIAVIAIHLVDSNYIMPKIVGSKVQINTLIALIGLVLGEMLWGITGMLLALPVIAVMKVVFDRVPSLNPWGMLLGDEEHESVLPIRKKKRKDDSVRL